MPRLTHEIFDAPGMAHISWGVSLLRAEVNLLGRQRSMNAEDIHLSKQRPEPNGINGWLVAFSFLTVIPFPLFCILALHRTSLSSTAERLTWIPVVAVLILGCLSLFSGCLLYIGNYYARTASLVFLFASLLDQIRSICDMWHISVFAFVIAVRFVIIGAILTTIRYFIASPICRNNYGEKKYSLPIRIPPLPKWKNIALLVWGSLILGGLLCSSGNFILRMQNQIPAYVPIAGESGKTSYAIVVNGHTFIIPKPTKAGLASTEQRSAGYGNTIVLSFAESASFSGVFYTVDYTPYSGASTSRREFFNRKSDLKSWMDELGSPLRVVAESANFIIRQDDGGLFFRSKLCDAQLLIDGQVLTLRMSSRSFGVRPAEMLIAMQDWIQEIIAANHGVQP